MQFKVKPGKPTAIVVLPAGRHRVSLRSDARPAGRAISHGQLLLHGLSASWWL